MALALMRNYDPFKAPTHFRIADLMKKFDKTFGATGKLRQGDGRPDARRHRAATVRPLELPVYRRHVVPGSVQLRLPAYRDVHHPVCNAAGEISFCAYNTGIGWRNIIEKMHMTATLTKWYENMGATRSSRATSTCRCRAAITRSC